MSITYDAVGTYTPGGRNPVAYRYASGGSLPYGDRVLWLGVLPAGWYEAGVEFGKKTADMIAACSDYWWGVMCDFRGHRETVFAMEQYWQQVGWLDEEQLALYRGIADGAAEALAASLYHAESHPLHAPDLTRVFAAAIFDCWIWGDPDAYGDPNAAPNTFAEQFISGMSNGCNSVAVLPAATDCGRTISSQVRHTQQAGLCYQASAAFHAEDGSFYDFWSAGNVPTPHGLLLVNSRGVSISHHFGGSTSQASLARGAYGGAYGVPWPNLLFYAIRHAATADEAIDLLLHGSERYRAATGRKTVLRDGTWNWMVCDGNTLAVAEVSPDRYCIRRPGEYTGDWTQKDFIVCANHFLCDHSYDENDRRSDIPMTVFNVNLTSEARFWTLMWELKDFTADGRKLDVHTLQYIFSRSYLRDRETGNYIYTLPDENGNMLPAGQAFGCVQGTLVDDGRANGTNAAKIAVLDGGRSACWFCLGNPKDWAGEWDNFTFSEA